MCVSICTHVTLVGRILECVEYWKGIEALPKWYNLALKPVIGLKALDCPAEILTEKEGRERCQKRFSLKPRWNKRKCYRLSKKLLLMSPYPGDSQNLNYWNIILIFSHHLIVVLLLCPGFVLFPRQCFNLVC